MINCSKFFCVSSNIRVLCNVTVLLSMLAYQQKIIRNTLSIIATTGLLFYAGFSMNHAAYGQQFVDNTNRTGSLNTVPENEAPVAIPTPSTGDISPETDQKAMTNEKVMESPGEINEDTARDNVEQAEIQNDELSESDQAGEDTQAQDSENEENEDNSNALEPQTDNADDEDDNEDNNEDNDVPFVLPFP
jgi:hypothetical protein